MSIKELYENDKNEYLDKRTSVLKTFYECLVKTNYFALHNIILVM